MTSDLDQAKKPTKVPLDAKELLKILKQQEDSLLKKGEKMLADLPVREEPDSE